MTAKYMKKLGYTYTFHAFRHSASTHLADAGVHPFTMAAMLGHSDPKMTLHYTHTNIQNCTELKALFQC